MSTAKVWEAIDYLKNKDTIEGIPVICLDNLLNLNKGETYNNYKLKNFMKNKGLVYRKIIKDEDTGKESAKMVFLECVKYYYDLPSYCKECNDITSDFLNIGDSYTVNSCAECHKKCLELFKNKSIMLK